MKREGIYSLFYVWFVPAFVYAQVASDSTVARSLVQQAADSTKAIPQKEVEVRAKRPPYTNSYQIPASAQRINADEPMKALEGLGCVTSASSISAVEILYGLPLSSTARINLLGFPDYGPMNVVRGGYTKVNSNVTSLGIQPALPSHQRIQTNGAIDLIPQRFSDRSQITFATDFLERNATFMGKYFITSIRQNGVSGPLRAIPALRAIPEYLDSQTYAEFEKGPQTLRGFFRIGRERAEFNDQLNGETGIAHDDNAQEFAVVQYELEFPNGTQLDVGTSWQRNSLNSEQQFGSFHEFTYSKSEVWNPRVTISSGNHSYTVWVGETMAKTEQPTPSHFSRADGGVEGKIIFGRLTLKPSASVQQFGSNFSFLKGVTVLVNGSTTTLIAGYKDYAEYLYYDNRSFGSVQDRFGDSTPQQASQSMISLESKPKHLPVFDFVRVTVVNKNMKNIVLNETRKDVPVWAGDVTFAKKGKSSYEIGYAYNHSTEGGGPLVGSIRNVFRAGLDRNFGPNLTIALEANFRDGMIQEIHNVNDPRYGQRIQLAPSTYLNMAATRHTNLFGKETDLTLTLFNLAAIAGQKAEIAQTDGRSIYCPPYANIRATVKLFN